MAEELTKQEEILKGIFDRLVAMQGSIAPQHHPNIMAHAIVTYLHVNGVVITTNGFYSDLMEPLIKE